MISQERRPLVTLGCWLMVCALIAPVPTNPNLQQNWTLVWSDEFDGPNSAGPDPLKWKFDIGGGGWGNNELETYTSRLGNAVLDGQGNLAIKSIKERYSGPDGISRDYT